MVGPIDDYCLLNPTLSHCIDAGDYEKLIGAFYIDLGSVKTLSGIWVLFGYDSSDYDRFCIGYSDNVPAIDDYYLPPNKICLNSFANY